MNVPFSKDPPMAAWLPLYAAVITLVLLLLQVLKILVLAAAQ